MSTLRRPDAYSCRYRRSLCRSQDSRLSRPALTATPGCSRSPEPTPRHRRIVMAKRATFAEVCLRPVQCFILLRQSCVFKFVCARKTPAQHRPMQSCAWNRVFHHSRPHNSRIGSGWKTAFISPMLYSVRTHLCICGQYLNLGNDSRSGKAQPMIIPITTRRYPVGLTKIHLCALGVGIPYNVALWLSWEGVGLVECK